MATITPDEIKKSADLARAAKPDVPLGIFLLIGVGDTEPVKQMKASMGNNFASRFFGNAAEVAQALDALTAMGIDRVQLTELIPGSHQQLASALLP